MKINYFCENILIQNIKYFESKEFFCFDDFINNYVSKIMLFLYNNDSNNNNNNNINDEEKVKTANDNNNNNNKTIDSIQSLLYIISVLCFISYTVCNNNNNNNSNSNNDRPDFFIKYDAGTTKQILNLTTSKTTK